MGAPTRSDANGDEMTDQPTDAATDSDALDPERARQDPRGAVEALERRVLGEPDQRLDAGAGDGDMDREDAHDGDTDDEAEFQLDLDPEDQGRADAVPPAPE